LWPLKFDYLIVALAPDYSWTAIGVPNGEYLWIMARDYRNPQATIEQAVLELKKRGYPDSPRVDVPHRWND
jgi:apolipoprotein D and lipocalin family protein